MTNSFLQEFRQQIIPLFDFTGNENSRELLYDLLTKLPKTQQEAEERQWIWRGMLKQPVDLTLTYSKSEFFELRLYLEDIRNRQPSHTISPLELFFNKTAAHREKGRMSHLILFFHALYRDWFALLDPTIFPVEFQAPLARIFRLFRELDLDHHYAIIRNKGISWRKCRQLSRLLEERFRSGKMDAFWQSFFFFEACHSIAYGIRRQHFNFPSFRDGPVSLVDGYHPLLKRPVTNSLVLDKNLTLITGPNMSGKSTLLKTIALCVHMAHLGLAIPATQAEMPFFDFISVGINLTDDLNGGYSHFMVEIAQLKEVVLAAVAGKKCFALFDELFRSTNNEDALAISKTTISGLCGFSHCFFIISTHLQALQPIAEANPQQINCSHLECHWVDDKPVFNYKLSAGWSDLKIGQLLFEQEGLNRLLGGGNA